MGKAVGIDPGTTKLLAAVKLGDVQVLVGDEHEYWTPSVVGIRTEDVLAGYRTVDLRCTSPQDAIFDIKRLIGRSYHDPEVQRVRDRYTYEVVAPSDDMDDDARVLLGGTEYSPVDITAKIFTRLTRTPPALPL